MEQRGTSTNVLPAVALTAVVILFGWLLSSFYVPAYQGVDENGYLCSARRLALTGDSGKYTKHPLEYVSENVVQTGDATFHAKYPLGYPWLCALGFWLGGPAGAFWVNPVLAVLTLVGIFFLARAMVNSYAGVLAAVLLATNPMHSYFGLSALSHTASIFGAVWGMFFLWRWAQSGGAWNAAAAGALTAYTYTARYSEALLALPVAVMIIWRFVELPEGATPTERRTHLRRWRWQVAAMLAGALVVAGALWAHHWMAFGAPWKNGYDLCGESTGFGWKWFKENWWTMLTRLNTPGLLLLFPLGAAGLVYLALHEPKRGALLCLWAVPAVLIYTAYYWAPQGEGRGYIRFFVSVFPAFIVGALALLRGALPARRISMVAIGVYVAVVSSFNLRAALPDLQSTRDQLSNVARTWAVLREKVPDGSIIVASGGLLNNLEYVGSYELYSHESFDKQNLKNRLKILNDNDPHPFQRGKAQSLARTVGDMSDADLVKMERALLATNVAAGRMVALIGPTDAFRSARGRLGEGFSYVKLAEWLHINFGKTNDPHPVKWVLYQLQPRGKETPPAEDLATVEEQVDMLQFRVKALRTEFDEKFPTARQKLDEITETERQLNAARDKVKALTARKPNPTKR